MALTERLALLISLDANGAVRGLENVGKAADRNLGKAESKLDRSAQKMQKFGTGALAATGIAAVGLYKAGQAASDLEQAVGGTEAVFKETSGVIEKFAKNAASDMGLSERAFREATTGIGGNLKRMGFDVDEAADRSIELTRTAADLAATYGGTTEEAVQALGAAFRGEADPAERFNLNLKASAVNAKAVELGLAASTSEIDENAKAQALLALITEQSADAQGQFAREAGTAAGSMQIASAEFENAKASLGESVAPILADIAGGLAGVAGGFSDLNEKTDGTLSKIAAFGTIGLGALGGIAFVTGKVIAMRETLGPLTDKIYSAETGFTSFGRTLGKVAGFAVAGQAVSLLANALSDLTGLGESRDLSNLSSELELLGRTAKEVGAVDLDRIATAIDEIIDPSAAENFGAGISRAIDGVGQLATIGKLNIRGTAVQYEKELSSIDDTLSSFVDSGQADLAEDVFNRISAAVEASGGSAEDAAAAFPQYATALEVAAARAGDADAKFLGYGAALEIVRGGADVTKGPLKDLADATEDAGDEAEDAGKAYSNLSDELSGMFDPLFGAIDAMDGVADAQEAVSDAVESVRDAQGAYSAAVKEHGRDSEEARDAVENLSDAQRDLERKQRDATRSAVDQETALLELRAEFENGNSTLDESIRKLDGYVQQGAVTEEQAALLKDELAKVAWFANAIPEKIGIDIEVNRTGYEQAVRDLTDVATGGRTRISVGGGGGNTLASGGLVKDAKYFATGGAVGTDTVPAMLTPGEFAIRRPVIEPEPEHDDDAVHSTDKPSNDRKLIPA